MLYRGYFFDWETGLYYLNARYYDPATGRFINSDVVDVLAVDQGNVMQFNLFAYCLNNPVNNTDSSGNWSLPNWAKIAITATIIVAAVVVVSTVTAGTGGAAACIALGAAKGAISGAVSGAVGGAISGAVGGAVSHRIETGTWEGAGKAALKGAAQGALDGAMSGAISGAITGAFTSPYCFVAGTAILTGAGYVAIENIKVGDLVWSSNPDTGETSLKEVLETYVNETDELIHVTVDGEEIVTTPSHPFYVPKQGWTDAIHLKAGDILLTVNGEYVVVEKVQHELLELPIKVYNFEVEDFHTYYVGDGVLVHNACTQKHHLMTNKNKKYTPKFKEITDKYGLDLADDWNIRPMENHSGRHTNKYHEFILEKVRKIDADAGGNVDKFKEGISNLFDFLKDNSDIMYLK